MSFLLFMFTWELLKGYENNLIIGLAANWCDTISKLVVKDNGYKFLGGIRVLHNFTIMDTWSCNLLLVVSIKQGRGWKVELLYPAEPAFFLHKVCDLNEHNEKQGCHILAAVKFSFLVLFTYI